MAMKERKEHKRILSWPNYDFERATSPQPSPPLGGGEGEDTVRHASSSDANSFAVSAFFCG
jgi:hypothetical protein